MKIFRLSLSDLCSKSIKSVFSETHTRHVTFSETHTTHIMFSETHDTCHIQWDTPHSFYQAKILCLSACSNNWQIAATSSKCLAFSQSLAYWVHSECWVNHFPLHHNRPTWWGSLLPQTPSLPDGLRLNHVSFILFFFYRWRLRLDED